MSSHARCSPGWLRSSGLCVPSFKAQVARVRCCWGKSCETCCRARRLHSLSGPPMFWNRPCSTTSRVREFLVSELLAARIISHKDLHPEESLIGEESVKEQRVEDPSSEFCQDYGHGDMEESDRRKAEMQAEWILLLRALGLDASSQLGDVQTEVKSRLDRLPGRDMASPLLTTGLNSEQWTEVIKISRILSEDYGCRRQMMIKRFQVTLESFAWGEKQKERRAALASVPPLKSFVGGFQVSLSHLLAAREDQSFIEPIKAGKSTPVYKALMGSVPDRGGRPGEIEPPMPSWQERRAQGHRGGGRGRGSGHQQRHRKKKGKE
ncbi:protein FAM98B isoform X2 [Kryptolebias marmoratus]|uniref:protein FAM98B isoform X2 n=1 Tax=Kryptolebias marmoratus TaxID=37003 RepID=UPI0007F8C94B|nr:protein FAM98B isoform X2 [Kryptolebias marmoratus]